MPSFWDWEPTGDPLDAGDTGDSGADPFDLGRDEGEAGAGRVGGATGGLGGTTGGLGGTTGGLGEGLGEGPAVGDGAGRVGDGAGRPGDGAGRVGESAPEPRQVVISPVDADPPREGIGRRVGNLAHLSSDPRMRAWQRRAIIAVIVGVVVSIFGTWQLGLTLAVLVAIADTIYRSRTVFNGPAGARLTVAQRRTRSQLAKLERTGYRAMHCSLIPDSEDQIDHLVVGPAGVFAIDSEAWDKRLVVRTKNGRQLWHGPYDMKDRLEHARWEADRAAELLSAEVGSPVVVRPAMVVYGPKISWDVATIRDVDVFGGPRLRKYLRRRARENGARQLSEGEAERIFKAASTAFPNPDPA